MSVLDTVKAFVKGKTPEAELTEIRAKIAAGVAEIAQLNGEIERRALPILRGDSEASRQAAELRTAKGEIEDRLVTLRQGEARSAAAVNAATSAAKLAEAVARPRRQAEIAAEFLAADRELRMLFQDAGDKLRAQISRSAGLAAELGYHVGRSFAAPVYMNRFRSTLAHHYATTDGVHRAATNLLRLESDAIGQDYWSEIDDLDRALLDDHCPLYLTQAEAEAAQARLAERNGRNRAAAEEAVARRGVGAAACDIAPAAEGAVDTIIARCGDVFTLIPHQALFASHAEAQAAMRAGSGWRAGGYAIVGWQDGAAIVRADLAGIIAPILAPAKAA